MNAELPAPQHKCANPQCKVSESGRCLEGLPLDECQTYGHDQVAEQATKKEDVAEPADNLIHLRSATSLQLPRASELLSRQDSRVIAIVGPREAGKTSLIASLFDLFQEGPVDGVSFAGSETLQAFELACHNSRVASRRTAPVQEHTGHGDVRFYHLDVAHGLCAASMTLLLGDRAGEDYLTAADDLAQAGPFPEIARADTVTVLVDGGRLLNNSTRHNTRSETGLMIRAMADGRFFQRKPHVIFALTKMDLVNASKHKDRALADFGNVVEHATAIIAPLTESCENALIAAAPADTSTARGTGISTLLQSWTRPITRAESPIVVPVSANRAMLNLRMPYQSQKGIS